MIKGTLHSANILVCMAGIATATGTLGVATPAIGAAMSVSELAKSMSPDAKSLAADIAAQLTTTLAHNHLTDTDRKLINQMIAASAPNAATIVAAGKQPHEVLEAMLAALADPAHSPPQLRQKFRNALGPVLATLMRDNAIAQRLEAAFQNQVLRLLNETNARLGQLIAQSADKARELHLTEQLFIGLAKRIAADVPDIDTAHRELERAVEIAGRMDRSGNLGDQINSVLDEVKRLNDADNLDAAQAVIDDALAQADAQKSRLLGMAVDQGLLRRDAPTAATHLMALADMDAGGRAAFSDLRILRREWYERGRDKGLNLDLMVAVALAHAIQTRAQGADETGAALNDLGIALESLGQRETGTARLEQAVAAYRDALLERTRDRVPLAWAMTQNNLGTALKTLGQRETGTARLEQAVAAYRAALLERTRDRVPLDWAATQNNLGNALSTLGQRETGTARLEEAVAAYRDALLERTRDRVPLGWAMTQNNLGTALRTLGERETGTARLEQAVAAYRAALLEYTRDRVPLNWAMTQNNLGNALSTLGERETGTARLEEAVAAYRDALLEHTRDRVPLGWATTIGNMSGAQLVLAARTESCDLSREALENLEQAAGVLRDGGHISGAEIFEGQLPTAKAIVARLCGA